MTAANTAALEQLNRTVRSIRYKLIDITQLFSVVCIPYKLWDLCLKIMNASHTDDYELAVRLWRSIIYR
jgi:hypothetical protein